MNTTPGMSATDLSEEILGMRTRYEGVALVYLMETLRKIALGDTTSEPAEYALFHLENLAKILRDADKPRVEGR